MDEERELYLTDSLDFYQRVVNELDNAHDNETVRELRARIEKIPVVVPFERKIHVPQSQQAALHELRMNAIAALPV